MIEIGINTSAALDIVFSAGYADASVTYLVKDGDGATVQSGTATKDNGVTGRYFFTLAPQSTVEWLTVTWSGAWSGTNMSISTGAGQIDGTAAEIQVAGGHLFTVAELRAFGDGAIGLNPSKYTDEVIIDARSRVTVLFEDYCGVAFVPRYGRVTKTGTFDNVIVLPNQKINVIRSVSIDGVALSDLSQVKFDHYGTVYRSGWYGLWSGVSPQNIVIGYEHGYTATPEPIARVAMILAKYELTMTNQMADRMITTTNEFGVIRQAQPGPKTPTGIPIVDSVLNQYCEGSFEMVM